jgi:hypothetical protein
MSPPSPVSALLQPRPVLRLPSPPAHVEPPGARVQGALAHNGVHHPPAHESRFLPQMQGTTIWARRANGAEGLCPGWGGPDVWPCADPIDPCSPPVTPTAMWLPSLRPSLRPPSYGPVRSSIWVVSSTSSPLRQSAAAGFKPWRPAGMSNRVMRPSSAGGMAVPVRNACRTV